MIFPSWPLILLLPILFQHSCIIQLSVTFTTARLCAFRVCLLTQAPSTTTMRFCSSHTCPVQESRLSKPSTECSKQDATSGCLHPMSITSFWTGCRLIGKFTCRSYSRLLGNTFCVLHQGILSWWDVFHRFVLLAEQLSPHFIDRTRMARLVVNDDCVTLQNFEV